MQVHSHNMRYIIPAESEIIIILKITESSKFVKAVIETRAGD